MNVTQVNHILTFLNDKYVWSHCEATCRILISSMACGLNNCESLVQKYIILTLKINTINPSWNTTIIATQQLFELQW